MRQTVQLRQDKRRRIHRILIGIILGTLPFYLCGIITLVGFGGESSQETATATETLTATIDTPTITLTSIPGDPTITLQFTPTQYNPPQPTTVVETPAPPMEPSSTSDPTSTPEDTTEATATVDVTGTFIIEQRLTMDAQHLTEMAVTRFPPEQGPGQAATQGQPVPPGPNNHP